MFQKIPSYIQYPALLYHLHFAAEAGTVLIWFSDLSSDKNIPSKQRCQHLMDPIFPNIL